MIPWSSFVLKKSSCWRALFFEEKSTLTECSPRASCYLEQGAGGSWILCCFKIVDLKKSFEWCALFWRKSALTEYSPRASCCLEQRVGGSWVWFVRRTEIFPCCSLWAFIRVLWFKKNSDALFLAYSLVVCCLSGVVVWWWLSVNVVVHELYSVGIFFRICSSSSTVPSRLSLPLLSPVFSLCPL